jgi:hypothetical protein
MSVLTRRSVQFSGPKRAVIVEWTLDERDRSAQRRAVAEKWAEERPYTNYRYNVEKCADGSRIYLLRPTWLNKGFDFQVNLEGFRSVTRTAKGATKEMPSHADVIHDLAEKVAATPAVAPLLCAAIGDVYDCKEVAAILAEEPALSVPLVGLPLDKILLVVKWLFVEQDVTYWLQTGRNMLMSGIEKNVFRL